MTPSQSQAHLSRITTLWSLVEKAHQQAPSAVDAQRVLMQRYCGAAYRYLLGAVRDEEAALELFQEFALRFVRGDFRRADPERGRFRDYVKTSLSHLVTDYHREQLARPRPLPPDLPAKPAAGPFPATSDDDFLASWREELVNRTWQALADSQPTLHAVLLAHVQNPDLPSRELADLLTAQVGKEVTAGNVRVQLHRARERFADLLLEEVTKSLEAPSEAELLQELTDLRLRKLCQPALDRRGHPVADGKPDAQ